MYYTHIVIVHVNFFRGKGHSWFQSINCLDLNFLLMLYFYIEFGFGYNLTLSRYFSEHVPCLYQLYNISKHSSGNLQ